MKFIKNQYYNLVPFEKRYGKVFSETFAFLMESQKWTKEKRMDYQFEELKRVLVLPLIQNLYSS